MTFDQAWKEIEKNFEWGKVYKIMELLNWYWVTDNGLVVPPIARLKKVARLICKQAWDEDALASTGGLQACKTDAGLVLEFVLTGWEAREEE